MMIIMIVTLTMMQTVIKTFKELPLLCILYLDVIREAFSDRHVEIDILTCEGVYCGANGYLYGVNTGMFLGEAPSNKEVRLRFGLHWRVDVQQGVIPEGYAIFDLPGFFIQNGINLYERARDPNYRI